MKRKDALNLISYAGYHGDVKTGMRIYIENRISKKAYVEAFRKGNQKKLDGISCTCLSCNQDSK